MNNNPIIEIWIYGRSMNIDGFSQEFLEDVVTWLRNQPIERCIDFWVIKRDND